LNLGAETHPHHCSHQRPRADFLAGQFFDIRLEVHQPVNGSEAIGLPLDEKFTFTVGKTGAAAKSATEYFALQEPKLEKWNFTWFEGANTQGGLPPSL